VKQPTGLHHLMTGVVHRRRGVVTGPDEREPVRDLRVGRKISEIWISGLLVRIGWNGPGSRAAASGFIVPGVQLARAQLKIRIADFSHSPFDCAQGIESARVGERETEAPGCDIRKSRRVMAVARW